MRELAVKLLGNLEVFLIENSGYSCCQSGPLPSVIFYFFSICNNSFKFLSSCRRSCQKWFLSLSSTTPKFQASFFCWYEVLVEHLVENLNMNCIPSNLFAVKIPIRQKTSKSLNELQLLDWYFIKCLATKHKLTYVVSIDIVV